MRLPAGHHCFTEYRESLEVNSHFERPFSNVNGFWCAILVRGGDFAARKDSIIKIFARNEIGARGARLRLFDSWTNRGGLIFDNS